MSKIGRNELCHCGSGKKYKKCCLRSSRTKARGSPAAKVETGTKEQVGYEIRSIAFGSSPAGTDSCAFVEGTLTRDSNKSAFSLAMAPREDGRWRLVDLRVADSRGDRPPPAFASSKDFIQGLLNASAKLLSPINMWHDGQAESGGAKILINEIKAPPEMEKNVFSSFRTKVLDVPAPAWEEMWSRIEARVAHDQHFRIRGFERGEIQRALPQLKIVFPDQWVRKRYAEADGKTEVSMNNPYPPGDDFWFPAYHLARTAVGAICVDPGWNYLLELGISLEELREVDGFSDVRRQVAQTPGIIHQICLAAELYRRDSLVSLEPFTGCGSARHDFLVSADDRMYDIEMKAFTSADPGRNLRSAISKKSTKLPSLPSRPVIFYAVLIERGEFSREREEAFLREVTALASTLPSNISCLVAGKMFVDAGGGRVKRDVGHIAANPRVNARVIAEDMARIFRPNFNEITYPLFGIGTFLYFDNATTATGGKS